MPVNKMNVGRDYTFGFYDGNTGTIVDLGDVQNVRVTANYHDIASRPYNDVPRFGYIPDGYSISFTITRTGPELEEFQLAASQRFNDGAIVKPGFLNETVTNQDGTVSRYQYTGFCFKVTDLGDISRESVVKMTCTGLASAKVKIA